MFTQLTKLATLPAESDSFLQTKFIMFTEKAPFETMQYLVKNQQLLTNGKLT